MLSFIEELYPYVWLEAENMQTDLSELSQQKTCNNVSQLGTNSFKLRCNFKYYTMLYIWQ